MKAHILETKGRNESKGQIFIFFKNQGLRFGRQHWQWNAVDPIDGEV